MGRPVTASVPHTLGKEEARRRIAEGFANAGQQMGSGMLGMLSFQERWEGDRLHFEGGGLGQKISGRLDVLPDSIQIQVDLPELLAMLADKITGKLKQQTQLLLEKK
jgi:hypothetical protein